MDDTQKSPQQKSNEEGGKVEKVQAAGVQGEEQVSISRSQFEALLNLSKKSEKNPPNGDGEKADAEALRLRSEIAAAIGAGGVADNTEDLSYDRLQKNILIECAVENNLNTRVLGFTKQDVEDYKDGKVL